MSFFLLVGIAIAVVWASVFFRFRPSINHDLVMVGGIFVVIAGAVFGKEFASIELFSLTVTSDRVLLGGLLAIWIYTLWQGGSSNLRFDWQDLTLLLWFVLISCSALLTDFGFRNGLPVSRLLYFNAIPLALYIVIRHTEWSPKLFGWTLFSFGFLSLYLSTIGIAESRGLHNLVWPQYVVNSSFTEFLGRARGPLLNPIINGLLIVTGMVCWLSLWPMIGRWYLRAGLLLALPVFIFGIQSTLTRSIWLSGAFSLAAMAWLNASVRMRVALVAFLLMSVPLVWMAKGESFFRFKRDVEVSAADMAESLELRPLLAIVAWEMIQDRPVFGVGFGQYAKYRTPYHFNDKYRLPVRKAANYFQHNVFLAYLVETGIVGFATLLAVLASAGCTAWRNWKSPSGSLRQQLAGLVTLILLGNYVINGMFHDVSIIPHLHHVLMFFLAINGRLVSFSPLPWGLASAVESVQRSQQPSYRFTTNAKLPS